MNSFTALINLETAKSNLNFNPNVSGSVECVIINHSDKETEWYCSHYEAMMMGSKPSVKKVKIINKYNAGDVDGNLMYHHFRINK